MGGDDQVIFEQLAHRGFAVVPDAVTPSTVLTLITAIEGARPDPGLRQKNSRVYAMRNLLNLVPEVRELACSAEMSALIAPALGRSARVVRGLLFDKAPGANWKVAWHQDLSIAVRRRADVPGYGPWSVKAGVTHVQPPVQLLSNMLTVRLSLDDCGPDNGPLQVLPGSHAAGVLSPAQVAEWRRRVPPVACQVPPGGALLMRPLLLHASSEATSPRRRRVVHLEYAAGDLAGGLDWHEGEFLAGVS
jgi:ectoine hydroxylase-related dioxygenase (phytanoyl-CoA dioxygenase family)